jgi:hypothetical protein
MRRLVNAVRHILEIFSIFRILTTLKFLYVKIANVSKLLNVTEKVIYEVGFANKIPLYLFGFLY